MKATVLAWGSLVWEPRTLAVAAFEPTGPRLPIEFCRVSRDGRLSLVIDETLGVPCGTYSAETASDDLDAAIENLRIRENMPTANGIGFVNRLTGRRSRRAMERHPEAVKIIDAWALAHGYDVAIWTALGSNFSDSADMPFSVEAAIRYLEVLDVKTLRTALNYIWRAPPEVQTPVRLAVNARWPDG